jgi:hypothetical protein
VHHNRQTVQLRQLLQGQATCQTGKQATQAIQLAAPRLHDTQRSSDAMYTSWWHLCSDATCTASVLGGICVRQVVLYCQGMLVKSTSTLLHTGWGACSICHCQVGC